MKQKVIPKCGKCGKRMQFNYDKKRWECPIWSQGGSRSKKRGCGNISDQNVLTGW